MRLDGRGRGGVAETFSTSCMGTDCPPGSSTGQDVPSSFCILVENILFGESAMDLEGQHDELSFE